MHICILIRVHTALMRYESLHTGCVHTYVHAHVCTFIQMHQILFTYEHVYTYIYACVCMRIHACTRVCIEGEGPRVPTRTRSELPPCGSARAFGCSPSRAVSLVFINFRRQQVRISGCNSPSCLSSGMNYSIHPKPSCHSTLSESSFLDLVFGLRICRKTLSSSLQAGNR